MRCGRHPRAGATRGAPSVPRICSANEPSGATAGSMPTTIAYGDTTDRGRSDAVQRRGQTARWISPGRAPSYMTRWRRRSRRLPGRGLSSRRSSHAGGLPPRSGPGNSPGTRRPGRAGRVRARVGRGRTRSGRGRVAGGRAPPRGAADRATIPEVPVRRDPGRGSEASDLAVESMG